MIDFCTTATCRPDLIERTYQSFFDNLKGIDFDKCVLYLNIDPIPDMSQRDATLVVARKFFKNVKFNLPDNPNLCKAVWWVFSQTTERYVFNIQDDWVLKEPIDVCDMIKTFESLDNNIVQLKLNPQLNEAISLNPAVMRGDFCRSIVSQFDFMVNPERQLNMLPDISAISWTYNPRNIRQRDDVIEDIGRDWRSKKNIHRRADYLFTTWQSNRDITTDALRSSYADSRISVDDKTIIDESIYINLCQSYWSQRITPYSVLKQIEQILERKPKAILSIDAPCYRLLFDTYTKGDVVDYLGSNRPYKYDLVVLDMDHAANILDYVYEDSTIILLSNNLIPLLKVRARYRGVISGLFNPLFINPWEMSLMFTPT